MNIFQALVWKNFLIKRRHPVATFIEIIIPLSLILIFSGLRTLDPNVVVPAGWSDNTKDSTDSLFSFSKFSADGQSPKVPQYYFSETTVAGLLIQLSTKSFEESERYDLILNELERGFNNDVSPGNEQSLYLAQCIVPFLFQGRVSTNTTSADFPLPSACNDTLVPYKLAITPDSEFTRNYFARTVTRWHPRIKLSSVATPDFSAMFIPALADCVVFFDSNDALTKYVSGPDYGSSLSNPKIYAALSFGSVPEPTGSFGNIDVSIRLNTTQREREGFGDVPTTNGNPPAYSMSQRNIDTTFYRIYSTSGFMTLQTLVSRFLNCMPNFGSDDGECSVSESTTDAANDVLNTQFYEQIKSDLILQTAIETYNQFLPSTVDKITFDTIPPASRAALVTPLRQAPQPVFGQKTFAFPTAEYISSPFFDAVKTVFPLLFILSYVATLSKLLRAFILEKETKIRELLKIMGVKEHLIITSWYCTYGLICFLSSALQTFASAVGLFQNSNVALIFLFFFLFGLDIIAFAFCISTFFSRAKTGSFFGIVIFFVGYFLTFFFSPDTSEGVKAFGCLIPAVALSFGTNIFATLEAQGAGVTFGTMSEPIENFRFQTALVFMVLDFVLYSVLGWYFEQVIQKEFGIAKVWYFPLTPSYWQKAGKKHESDVAPIEVALNDENQNNELVSDVENPYTRVQDDNVEASAPEYRQQEENGTACVISNLTKVFPVPGGEKTAVNNLSLSFYKNQITCLLGHNGAGKTTTISILTGQLPPTSGDAKMLNGLSLVDDIDTIRKSIGMCPQHDVLYAELTVKEHLLFFGRIKGYSDDKELHAVVDKKIAEVGLTEKINVFSSTLSGGMKRKLSVSIALLGDSKIVFLDEPTSGMDPYSRRSTWELLQNNRQGRIMVLTTHFMDEADLLGDRIAIMAEGQVKCCGSSLFLKNRFGAGYNLTMVKSDPQACDVTNLLSFIQHYVPTAKILSNVGTEVSFQLAIESASKFPDMFRALDTSLAKLCIQQYGISVTTMEEVFLKVAESSSGQELNERPRQDDASLDKQNTESYTLKPENRPKHLFTSHLQALLIKRWQNAKRDRKALLYSIFLPILLLCFGFGSLYASGLADSQPTLLLDPVAAKFPLGTKSPTPYFCASDQDSTCQNTMDTFSRSSLLRQVIQGFPPPKASVFNVDYPANLTESQTLSLQLGDYVYQAAYTGNGTSDGNIALGQMGAYIVEINALDNSCGYATAVNTTAKHAAPVLKADLDQTLYRYFANFALNDVARASRLRLSVSNEPLPLTTTSKAIFNSFLSFSATIFIAIAFAYYPASIVVFIVKEREEAHNCKYQQLVSGVSIPAFWAANYIWDMLVYLVPASAALILIQAFDITSLTGSGTGCVRACTTDSFASVVVLFLLFGLAIIPFTYLLSFVFREHSAALNITLMINFVLGVVLLSVSFVLDIIESTADVNQSLKYLWRFSPLFNLANGCLRLTIQDIQSGFGRSSQSFSAFDLELTGTEMIYLAIQALVGSALVLGVDYYQSFPPARDGMSTTSSHESRVEEDQDVLFEANRIASKLMHVTSDTEQEQEAVIVSNLRKVYPVGQKVAVRDLSFGLAKGECFGFLGINGAGKTTTLKMLTGITAPTSGTAMLQGHNILTEQLRIRQLIGYCPQFDALLELLSVREHLELFARIKGVPAADMSKVVEEKMTQFKLTDFETKLAGTLSGGNRRKLCVAIAMIGSPPIIILDEPSTGMDPVARRFMWDVIAQVSTTRKESTIILTTHSMEECEALSSKVGIMVGGRLRCLGSIQHLKNKFGNGLMLEIKLCPVTRVDIETHVARFTSAAREAKTQLTLAETQEALVRWSPSNDRYGQMTDPNHATGWLLWSNFERDGFVKQNELVEWFISEERFDAVTGFLHEAFVAGIEVLERHQDQIRIQVLSDRLALAQVFETLEQDKDRLCIKEYSVSQTTLEQIFNSFASQQDEEQGKVRGLERPVLKAEELLHQHSIPLLEKQ